VLTIGCRWALALGVATALSACADSPTSDGPAAGGREANLGASEGSRAPAAQQGAPAEGRQPAGPQEGADPANANEPPGPDDTPGGGRGAEGEQPCDPGPPLPEAFKPGGIYAGQVGIIPGGRAITPRGSLTALGRGTIGLAIDPLGQRAYVTGDGDSGRGLYVVDLETGELLQTLGGFRAFRALAITPDGGRVVIATADSSELRTFVVTAEGLLEPEASLQLDGYLGALELSPDGALAYVASNSASIVFVVRLSDMSVQGHLRTGNYPYDLLVAPDGRRLFVSNLASDSVSVIALPSGELVADVPVPQGPQGMALAEGSERLYVACADADSVSVLDSRTLQELATVDLSHHPEGLLAGSPNDVALSVDESTLYVVQADLNQIDLVATADGSLLGSLPSGWYPVGVAALPDGERLAVLNTKGLGSGPRRIDPIGMLQVAPLPVDEADLQAQTDQVWRNTTRPTRFYARQCAQIGTGKLPIEHVVLIVRENKTYDMVLGDLEGANGDPELTLFGWDVTPNLHRLAGEFVNMDNFYSDPEESLQGHLWTTRADCSDFVEKLRYTQLPLAGYEPAARGGAPSIFEHCLDHGVPFRNYGEITSFAPELLGRMRDFIDPKFPFFNMNVLDQDKAREVIREWELGIFPAFIYIALPNDHTLGTRPGAPTPRSMVADNDRATGMLVDWLSRSRYWENTVVFIIEDDPQSYAGDHVDAHRSLCVVAGGWVKRGYVSHVNYSIPSMYRTIEMLLGLPPMNKNTALAAPMHDIFRTPEQGPDLRPFEAAPLAIPHRLNPEDAPMAAESVALGLGDGVDGAAGLGYILWRAIKGDVEPPPYAKGIDR